MNKIDLREKAPFLRNTNLTSTKDDQSRNFKIAKQVAMAYNIIGLLGTYTLLFLVSKSSAIIMGLVYPSLGILIMKFSNGSIKLIGNNKSEIPNVTLGFLGSAMILMFTSFYAYQIFEFKNLWLICIILTIVVLGLLYFIGLNKSIDREKGQIFSMVIMSLLYAFGGVTTVNCEFDKSHPQVYKAAVLAHEIHHGKQTSYLLTLSQWGPMSEQKQEDVSSGVYNNVSVGDSVEIYFRKGVLNAPWYYVSE